MFTTDSALINCKVANKNKHQCFVQSHSHRKAGLI